MWWWAEVSAGGTRSSGTVIFAMRARHSARRPHRTGASARRTRAVTLLRQPDIVGREDVDKCSGPASVVLDWFGRRVGGLGLTCYWADAAGCLRIDLSDRVPPAVNLPRAPKLFAVI